MSRDRDGGWREREGDRADFGGDAPKRKIGLGGTAAAVAERLPAPNLSEAKRFSYVSILGYIFPLPH